MWCFCFRKKTNSKKAYILQIHTAGLRAGQENRPAAWLLRKKTATRTIRKEYIVTCSADFARTGSGGVKNKRRWKNGRKIKPEAGFLRRTPERKRVEKITSPEYDRLAEEANKRIRKNQLKQAKAYAEAGMYFCKK